MTKGIDRLKGILAVSAMGFGLMTAGSGHAASISLNLNHQINLAATIPISPFSSTPLSVNFSGIGGIALNDVFDISGFSVESIATSDIAFTAFNGALGMSVDGNVFKNPDITIDLTGSVVTSGTVVDIVPGINAQIQYAFFGMRGGSSMGLVRAL